MKYFAVPVHPGDVGLPLRPAASPPGDHEARAPVAAGSANPDVPPSDVVTDHQRAGRRGPTLWTPRAERRHYAAQTTSTKRVIPAGVLMVPAASSALMQ